MTNRTEYPPAQQYAGEARPPASQRSAAHWSIRTASITAGVALLLMSVVAIFGNVVAVDGLVTEGDAARTAADIMASQGLFRLGIASLIVVVALDVVVAWALYRVFSPVNASLSMLAAALRLVYSGVFMVAIGQLLGVVRLLSDDGYRALFGADQVQCPGNAGNHRLQRHLVRRSVPVRSSPAPHRLPGLPIPLHPPAVGCPACHRWSRICHRQHGCCALLQSSWTDISSFTFIGEFLLALWLLIRARHIAASTSERHEGPITDAR